MGRLLWLTPTIALLLTVSAFSRASKDAWIELTGPKPLDAWKSPTGVWAEVGKVEVDPKNPKRLVAEPGAGILFNGPLGRSVNLVTTQKFGDLEAHVEFLVPKGSNSGVKFGALYEVQIFDSWGVKTPKATDNGGIYPRAELLPKYHYLDDGYPPRVNASKPPGEWQTLDIVFRAPRFDAEGMKIGNARFEKVILNEQLIHKDVELAYPTGHNWSHKETARGPFFLQADHGPVAFRNVRVRPLAGSEGSKKATDKP
jgi:hypothetical protein